jgi:hypothetical protein
MVFLPGGGIINIDNNSSSNVGSVGSDIEEIIQWDRELCQSKTFTTAFTILVSHRWYHGLKMEDQQKLLKCFIDKPG